MTKDNSTGKPKDFYAQGKQKFDSLYQPDNDDDDTQVYQKPWQGLMDEEVTKILEMGLDTRDSIKTAIDQLRKKNT